MSVRLLVHLERIPEEPMGYVWWAECDEVAGFSAAADHLPELVERSLEALRDLVGPDVELDVVLAQEDPQLEAEGARFVSDETTLGREALTVRVAVPA